ncbi:hypothetical protein [Pseudoxanthobacter sp.]|uniref:hypothetical protein n=1 Tax=Pseudoxanthobacter sp. TaxID=1925742 RepID=UPI002FE36817
MSPKRFAARSAAQALGLGALLLLAGCGGGESLMPSADSTLGKLLRGTSEQPQELAPELLAPRMTCPPVTIRSGLQTWQQFAGPGNDPMMLRYQGTIGETARQCSDAGDQMSINVGIAGRVLTGPKGGPGSVALPVKITVADSDEKTLYSKVFRVPVSISDANGVAWSVVQDNILVPKRDDLVIFVGFDLPAAARKPAPPAGAGADAPLDP